MVSMMSKITEDKLSGLNYSDWSKTIRLYWRSIHMASHLDKDPPTNDSCYSIYLLYIYSCNLLGRLD